MCGHVTVSDYFIGHLNQENVVAVDTISGSKIECQIHLRQGAKAWKQYNLLREREDVPWTQRPKISKYCSLFIGISLVFVVCLH